MKKTVIIIISLCVLLCSCNTANAKTLSSVASSATTLTQELETVRDSGGAVTADELLELDTVVVIKKADVLIGLSAAGIVTEEMIKSMNSQAIVFALANPTPEIMPNLAKDAGAYIVATGRSDFENQINNSLAFPGIFKGVLQKGIKKITDDIKYNAALAIADYALEDLSVCKILPNALDRGIVDHIVSSL